MVDRNESQMTTLKATFDPFVGTLTTANSVYDICRLQTADRRMQTADCMRQQDCKLNETKNIVIKVASSSTLPCSEK